MHGRKLVDFADAGDSDERRRLMSTNQHSAESVPVARQPIRRHHEPQQQHQYDAHTPTHSLSTIYCLSAVIVRGFCSQMINGDARNRTSSCVRTTRPKCGQQPLRRISSVDVTIRGRPRDFFSRGRP